MQLNLADSHSVGAHAGFAHRDDSAVLIDSRVLEEGFGGSLRREALIPGPVDAAGGLLASELGGVCIEIVVGVVGCLHDLYYARFGEVATA